MENPFALSWNDTTDKVYQSVLNHVPHVLEPSKPLESSALNTLSNEDLVWNRITCEEAGYPLCESRYVNIAEFVKERGYSPQPKPKYIGSGEDFCFELFEKD